MRTRNQSKPITAIEQKQQIKKQKSKTIKPKDKKTPPKNKTKKEKSLQKAGEQKQKLIKQKPNEDQQKQITEQKKLQKQEPQKEQNQQLPKTVPKKVPKPKKYLNKNYQQHARIARSQYQKIYLLQAERSQEGQWNFLVQGTSGSNYRVHIHHTALQCTCVDFRMKKKPCKHIYFIVTQVAQNPEILDYFSNSLKISKTAFKILDDQLINRLSSRMKKQQTENKEDIDLKDDTDCTICFTEMDKTAQTLEGCKTCKKYFHFECLAAWKKQNPSCPLCRSALAGGDNDKNPLGKLQTIQINSQNPE